MGFKGFGDLRMQLLACIAQQTAVSCVLHQRVLEAVDRVGWSSPLEDQLGSDKASKSGVQLVLGKAGHGAKQRVGKLASNRRASLRYQPYRGQTVESGHQ